MKKLISIVVVVLFISGCAGFNEIMDIIAPDTPRPVCDNDSAWETYAGKVCVKYSDGSYRWEKQ